MTWETWAVSDFGRPWDQYLADDRSALALSSVACVKALHATFCMISTGLRIGSAFAGQSYSCVMFCHIMAVMADASSVRLHGGHLPGCAQSLADGNPTLPFFQWRGAEPRQRSRAHPHRVVPEGSGDQDWTPALASGRRNCHRGRLRYVDHDAGGGML